MKANKNFYITDLETNEIEIVTGYSFHKDVVNLAKKLGYINFIVT